MKNKFKAVIFDLDGTLLNSLQDIADSVNSVLKRFDYPTHNLDDYRIFVGDGIRKLVKRAFPVDSFQNFSLDYFVNETISEYHQFCDRKTMLYDGIQEVLSTLSELQISISICTNKPQIMAEKAVQNNLSNWTFEHVIGIDKSTPLKPDPSGANRIIESQSIERNNFLFVGDSDTDMTTARNARISGIAVSWGFRKKQELLNSSALVVIDHPLELLEYFNSVTK
jgi:phosphoglycolate phosphatase